MEIVDTRSICDKIDRKRNSTALFYKVMLNESIFEQVQGYLNKINGTYRNDTNNVLNLSRKFQVLKKAKFYWKLTKESSAQYYFDDNYRSKVNMLLTHTKLQLRLDLSGHYGNITDVSVLSDIHTLDLSDCQVIDVSALGNTYFLDLSGCEHVSDFSGLSHVNTLLVRGFDNLSDVNALGTVHTLVLSDCWGLTNVSALGNVHNLFLDHCPNIIDVSALGTVHTLDLSDCARVSDVSAHIHYY